MRHLTPLCLGTCFYPSGTSLPPAPAYLGAPDHHSNILALFPSAKKPFLNTSPPFPANLHAPPLHSPRSWYKFLVLSRNADSGLVSPANLYSTPVDRKVRIPRPSKGLTLCLMRRLIKMALLKRLFYSFTFCAISKTNKDQTEIKISCNPTELTKITLNFFLLIEVT